MKEKKKEKKKKEIRRNEKGTSVRWWDKVGKWWEMPPLLGSIRRKRKNERGWKENRIEKEKKKENRGEKGRRKKFSTFRRSKLDGPRIKVGPHNESYVWVPKSESFVKL